MMKGEHVTTNRPRAMSRLSPYFSLILLNIVSLLDLRSSLLKAAVKKMVAAARDATVSAIRDDVASAAVPAREADIHMIPSATIQILKKHSIVDLSNELVKQNCQIMYSQMHTLA